MQCRYCGKSLGFLRKLTDKDFCSEPHQKAYEREQQQLVLASLLDGKSESAAAAMGGTATQQAPTVMTSDSCLAGEAWTPRGMLSGLEDPELQLPDLSALQDLPGDSVDEALELPDFTALEALPPGDQVHATLDLIALREAAGSDNPSAEFDLTDADLPSADSWAAMPKGPDRGQASCDEPGFGGFFLEQSSGVDHAGTPGNFAETEMLRALLARALEDPEEPDPSDGLRAITGLENLTLAVHEAFALPPSRDLATLPASAARERDGAGTRSNVVGPAHATHQAQAAQHASACLSAAGIGTSSPRTEPPPALHLPIDWQLSARSSIVLPRGRVAACETRQPSAALPSSAAGQSGLTACRETLSSSTLWETSLLQAALPRPVTLPGSAEPTALCAARAAVTPKLALAAEPFSVGESGLSASARLPLVQSATSPAAFAVPLAPPSPSPTWETAGTPTRTQEGLVLGVSQQLDQQPVTQPPTELHSAEPEFLSAEYAPLQPPSETPVPRRILSQGVLRVVAVKGRGDVAYQPVVGPALLLTLAASQEAAADAYPAPGCVTMPVRPCDGRVRPGLLRRVTLDLLQRRISPQPELPQFGHALPAPRRGRRQAAPVPISVVRRDSGRAVWMPSPCPFQ